ncbi:hypothetical protein [Pedobacter sp.]
MLFTAFVPLSVSPDEKSGFTPIGAINGNTLLFTPAMYHYLCKINLGEVVMRNGAQHNAAFERSKGLHFPQNLLALLFKKQIFLYNAMPYLTSHRLPLLNL